MNKQELKTNKLKLYNFINKINQKNNNSINAYLINNFIDKYNEMYSIDTNESDLYNTISLFTEDDFVRLGCILDFDIENDLIFINRLTSNKLKIDVKAIRKYAVELAYKNFNKELNRKSLDLVKVFLLKTLNDDLVSKYTFYKNKFQLEEIIDIEFNKMRGIDPERELNDFMQKHTMFGGFDEYLKVLSENNYDQDTINEVFNKLDSMENRIDMFLDEMNN